MRIGRGVLGALAGLALGVGGAPAQAEILTFQAALDGNYGADPTGSDATGKAQITVDTERRLVSVDMTVEGITADALWDTLVAAPVGPIHFHKYATPEGGAAVLVLPVPYGEGYRATANGLHVTMKDYDYAAGAALLKSTLTFDGFVAALRSGLVILNVHTDKFNPGEISGTVSAG